MLRLPILTLKARIGVNFFNNSNIKSLSSISAKSVEAPVNFLRSNWSTARPIRFSPLQSTLGIRTSSTLKQFQRSFHQSRTSFRSDTWSNYNKYYHRTSWDKLKKPAIFTVLFCAATTLVVPYLFDYTPLSVLKRSPSLLVYGMIAINGAVFLAWRVPALSRYTLKYGLLVKDNIQSQWSLLGSAFSHQSLTHFLVNMFVLQSFGTSFCAIVGVSNFAVMYLNSAVISSFISIALPTLMRTSLSMGSLGASGAVFSVFGAFSYLIPKAPIGFFFIPVPGGAWVFFLASVAYNVAGTALKWGKYDYAAHLGGSLAGVAYGWWFNKKRQANKRRTSRHFGSFT